MYDIIKASYLGGYKIRLIFENGKEGVVDLEEYSIMGGVFEKFTDPEYFNKFRINEELGVLYWPDGEDIAPETIYSLAKKYQANAQAVVDWPYNSFANDETFALAVGQELMIPDGVKPKEVPIVLPRYYAQAPAAGTVTGTGQFAWPTSGNITQTFKWYHQAIDIANRAAPDILAADAGSVIVVGWPAPWDYGNRVIIDHGNGFVTWYAHLSQIYVSAGQTVGRGQALGRMGSTGRSTGTHLHFEIHKDGVKQDPLAYLK